MILRIFTVYDSKAELYLPPFYEQTIGQAIRAFTDTSNNTEHPFCKHSPDFTLFEIGTFDNLTASVTTHNAMVSLINALEAKTNNDIPQHTKIEAVQ